jgi:pimeloyl-ACP methyl ester carboxylesterase
MNWLVRHCPILVKGMMQLSFKTMEKPKRLKTMLKQLPTVDAEIFENPRYKECTLLALKEAFRQGASGVVDEFKLLATYWGFDLEQIQSPLVVWQGELDRQAPIEHAEIYAQHVPQVEYRLFSILHHYGKDILTSAL